MDFSNVGKTLRYLLEGEFEQELSNKTKLNEVAPNSKAIENSIDDLFDSLSKKYRAELKTGTHSTQSASTNSYREDKILITQDPRAKEAISEIIEHFAGSKQADDFMHGHSIRFTSSDGNIHYMYIEKSNKTTTFRYAVRNMAQSK
jgi:hypothetical protein